MGWFDSVWGSRSGDPLQKLDPKVREFLEKESPLKYQTGQENESVRKAAAAAAAPAPKPASIPDLSPIAPNPQQGPFTASITKSSAAAKAPEPAEDGPKPTLYADGRYANLWKTYRPLAAIEAETKTDHEKLTDVLDAYKQRKAAIGNAALENCALEQLDWNNCMKGGSLKGRMTMCREEVRKFERCHMMQSKLLKALGYLSTYDRPSHVDEEIQMHADTIYHRMLDQEAAIEAAKQENKPIPKFEPLIPKPVVRVKQESGDILDSLNAEARRNFYEKLEKVPQAEKAAEEAAMRAEIQAQVEVASRVQDLWQEQAEARRLRKEQGKETVKDKLAGIIGK